jgi:signal peptidase I
MSTVLELPRTKGPSPAADPSRPVAPSRAAHRGNTTGGARKAVRRAGAFLTTGLFIIAVAAFLMLAIGPRILGYQTSTMLTGSMSPLINPGDVVVTVPTPVSEIRVGDIITYHIPVEDNRVETHRITKITTNANGTTAINTKGDANNGADPWTATLQGQTVDRHVATVPFIGQAIRALRQPVVQNSLIYGAPAVLVIGLLSSIWRKNPETETPGRA